MVPYLVVEHSSCTRNAVSTDQPVIRVAPHGNTGGGMSIEYLTWLDRQRSVLFELDLRAASLNSRKAVPTVGSSSRQPPDV